MLIEWTLREKITKTTVRDGHKAASPVLMMIEYFIAGYFFHWFNEQLSNLCFHDINALMH